MVVVAVHQTKGLPNIAILHAFKDLQFKDWQATISQKAEHSSSYVHDAQAGLLPEGVRRTP